MIHMRSLCISQFQNLRSKMRLIRGNPMLQTVSCTNICFDNLNRLGGGVRTYSVKPVASNTNRRSQEKFGPGLWVDEAKRISERLKPQQPIKTDVYTRKKNIHESKPEILKPNKFLDGAVPEKTEEPVHGLWVDETKRIAEKSKKQQVTTAVYTRKNNIQGSSPGILKPSEILPEVIPASTSLHVNASETNMLEGFGVQRNSLTILVFDLETTGFSRSNDSIIEIGLRDLNGGADNCFTALVNPGREVTNWDIHGITTQMVNRSNVPRFKDLIPILRSYIRRRQIPNQPVLLVAHNARTFDVPFLINEFKRCSEEIPSDWQFLDTMPLARELTKLEGPKKLMGKSLKDLSEYYEIPLMGKAHRAMADVDTLSVILAKMTMDLQIPISGLLERSFKASDIGNNTKKKKSTP